MKPDEEEIIQGGGRRCKNEGRFAFPLAPGLPLLLPIATVASLSVSCAPPPKPVEINDSEILIQWQGCRVESRLSSARGFLPRPLVSYFL